MSQHKDSIDAVPEPTRRNFLVRIWIILGFVAFAEILWLFVSFLKPRKHSKNFEKNATVTCGPIDRFEPGSVTAFPQGKFYLARLKDGGFLALSRECTHLGCTVPWVPDENRFVCPCHASSFDITGNVINPPAPRALDLFPVTIENNIVRVDISSARKRKRFEKGQVVRGY
jgi:cytochrome b6-f complex iron-sulfur subunit